MLPFAIVIILSFTLYFRENKFYLDWIQVSLSFIYSPFLSRLRMMLEALSKLHRFSAGCYVLCPRFEVSHFTTPHTGRGISIGSEFAWHASGPEFDPHHRHILSWRLGHENISTAILLLPLIQEEQLLAKECALSTGKLPRTLAQEQCG